MPNTGQNALGVPPRRVRVALGTDLDTMDVNSNGFLTGDTDNYRIEVITGRVRITLPSGASFNAETGTDLNYGYGTEKPEDITGLSITGLDAGANWRVHVERY